MQGKHNKINSRPHKGTRRDQKAMENFKVLKEKKNTINLKFYIQ